MPAKFAVAVPLFVPLPKTYPVSLIICHLKSVEVQLFAVPLSQRFDDNALGVETPVAGTSSQSVPVILPT